MIPDYQTLMLPLLKLLSCVSVQYTYEIKKLDYDYFEE